MVWEFLGGKVSERGTNVLMKEQNCCSSSVRLGSQQPVKERKLPNLGSNSRSSLPGSYPLTVRLLGQSIFILSLEKGVKNN